MAFLLLLKKKIIKLATCLIPGKDKRRLIRKRLEYRWGCLQTAAYNIYFDSVWHKRAGLLENADKIDTLILGDSHAQFGVVPFLMGPGAYNYAFNANSLYETFESLKFAAGHCKNLKTVILMCSFYNGGYSLIRGSEAWHCRILAKKFAMNYDFSLNPGYDFDFYDKIIEKLLPDPDKVCCQGYDFVGQRINRSTKKTRERALHHYKIYQKYDNQWPLLEKICQFCASAGIRPVIVDSPARSDYTAVLDEAEKGADLSAGLKQIAKRLGVSFVEMSGGFDDEDFADADHLNFNGAVKLTRWLMNSVDIKQ